MTNVSDPTPSPATYVTVPDLAIDRTSPVPLYFQVAQHLEEAIASGDIPAGTLFENEILLGEQLGVSRPTLRRAMQHLVEKGLIVRRRGVGTRVVQPKVRRPLELSSLYDDLAGSGQQPTTALLALEEVDADTEVATRLGIHVGEPALRIVRLRSAKEQPIAKMTNYLPAHLGPLSAEALQSQGLYHLLRSRGIQLHTAHQTIGARPATASEAKLLKEDRGAALLTMQRVTYDDHGAVAEYGSHVYAASRYSFEISLLTP